MKLKKEYIEKYLADFHYELTREQLEQEWKFDKHPYYREKDCWCFHAKDGSWIEVSNCDIYEAFDVIDGELVLLRLQSEDKCDFQSSWSNGEMKPITELYRIVEGSLKDDSNMIMRYVKRIIDRFGEDKSMNIDWNETEKGVREILNKYNHRPAKIATLDDDLDSPWSKHILDND